MRVKSDVRFALIPEWILFSDISPQAIRLYLVLQRMADKDGTCDPTRRTLATKLQVRSVRTVDAALNELEDKGALAVENRTTDSGDPTSNLYVLNGGSSSFLHDGIAETCSQNESQSNERSNSLVRGGSNKNNAYGGKPSRKPFLPDGRPVPREVHIETQVGSGKHMAFVDDRWHDVEWRDAS